MYCMQAFLSIIISLIIKYQLIRFGKSNGKKYSYNCLEIMKSKANDSKKYQ